MVLLSQDRLKAISAEKVEFLVISPEKFRGKHSLLAKTSALNNNYYDYLILFEYENIEVVKRVMLFLIRSEILVSYDADNQNVLGVVGKLKVNNTSSEEYEIQEAKSQFVETSGDVAIILNELKKPFNDVALFVQF